VDKLNELLRGELSAVETYDLALRSVRDRDLSRVLRQIRDSHDHRVTLLFDRLRQLGAEPARGSGAWGAFAKVVQRGADLLGDGAATAALENGEDHGIRLYTQGLDGVSEETRAFIVSLLPMQRESRELCLSLRQFVRAA
jgi:demethoxyubiquinone hydroxylase (CLK1/Coq7/Cat5 family)